MYGISGNSLPKAGSCFFFFFSLPLTRSCGIFLTSYNLQILFLTKMDVYTFNFDVFIYIVGINVPEAGKNRTRQMASREGGISVYFSGWSIAV